MIGNVLWKVLDKWYYSNWKETVCTFKVIVIPENCRVLQLSKGKHPMKFEGYGSYSTKVIEVKWSVTYEQGKINMSAPVSSSI